MEPTLRRSFALFALILFAGTASAGDPNLHATLETSSLKATDAVIMTGSLVALLQEQTNTNGGGANAAFTLFASALRVEEDRADLTIHAGTAFYRPIEPTMDTTDFRDAVVEGVSNAAGYRWNLFAVEGTGVEVSTPCADAKPSDTATLERDGRVRQRPSTTRGVSTAVSWNDCGQGEITVTGDFVLSLWEWDATLTADGSTRELRSGQERSSQIPAGAPDVSGTVSDDREIYLFATNATLIVPRLTGAHALYTDGATVSASSLRFDNARGDVELAGRSVVADGTVDVNGHATATLEGRGAGRPLRAQLDGRADALSVNGQPVAAGVAPQSPAFDGGVRIILGVGLLVVLLGIVVWFERPFVIYWIAKRAGDPIGTTEPVSHRERRGIGYWILAARALNRHSYRRARILTARSRRLFPASMEGKVMEGFVPHLRGDYQESYRIFSALHALLPMGKERADLACFCAEAAMGIKKPKDALKWLRQAARDHFPTFKKSAKSPIYDPLLGDEWFSDIRESAPWWSVDGQDPAFA